MTPLRTIQDLVADLDAGIRTYRGEPNVALSTSRASDLAEVIDQLTILGDALGEYGFASIADLSARFARGLMRAYYPDTPRGQTRGALSPTATNWQRLRRMIDEALLTISFGRSVARSEARPTIRLDVQRIPLDRGGYDRRGRYYGTGKPLFNVSNYDGVPIAGIPRLQSSSRYWHFGELFWLDRDRPSDNLDLDHAVIDTTLRANNAVEARDLVAAELGVKGVARTPGSSRKEKP